MLALAPNVTHLLHNVYYCNHSNCSVYVATSDWLQPEGLCDSKLFLSTKFEGVNAGKRREVFEIFEFLILLLPYIYIRRVHRLSGEGSRPIK